MLNPLAQGVEFISCSDSCPPLSRRAWLDWPASTSASVPRAFGCYRLLRYAKTLIGDLAQAKMAMGKVEANGFFNSFGSHLKCDQVI